MYIKGHYRKSIFQSPKGYVIGLFKVRETNNKSLEKYLNKTITFTGYFHELNEDDTYIFYGEPVVHERYGFQFQVTKYERVKPTDKEGIIEFLSSDLFKGVGPTLARSIVDKLGKDALEKIIKDKTCLNLVPKITKKKINIIHQVLLKYEESHQTIVYLTELGFNMRDALTIYNTYQSMTIDVINNNIYKLIEIKDITFPKIDNIAKKMKINSLDKRRVKAIIVYIMTLIIYKNSDTFLTKDNIENAVNRYVNSHIEDQDYDLYFTELEKERKIKIDNNDYYLKEIWDDEINIVNIVHTLVNKKVTKYQNIEKNIKELENENNIIYNQNQKVAIQKALENNILIITGGPGTGKTTIIKAITELYRRLNNLDLDQLIEQLALLAPTGRAAKRMSQSTLLPASTIHRYLKWNKDTNEFMVNETNKSKSKLIIIDEVSMIDINLFSNLLKGLRSNIKLILVGDYNQLASVGPGQVLKDLIKSDIIDIIYLDRLYRQDENSYISTLAMEINEGKLSQTFLETKSDYTFLKCNPQSVKNNLKNLCQKIIDKGYNYKQVQILAPMYKGENGIDLLNKTLQEVFNPKSKEKKQIKYGEVIYRENDKVLQLENMPDNNVYNGDIGVIKYIKYGNTSESKRNEVYIDFDGNLVKYTQKDLVKIKHGFIISIHKSQGSEFEIVIMPLVTSYNRMLYRKLIYTGITRAKKKLILIGQPQALIQSVENNNEYQRKTKLLEKLMYKFNN